MEDRINWRKAEKQFKLARRLEDVELLWDIYEEKCKTKWDNLQLDKIYDKIRPNFRNLENEKSQLTKALSKSRAEWSGGQTVEVQGQKFYKPIQDIEFEGENYSRSRACFRL